MCEPFGEDILCAKPLGRSFVCEPIGENVFCVNPLGGGGGGRFCV